MRHKTLLKELGFDIDESVNKLLQYDRRLKDYAVFRVKKEKGKYSHITLSEGVKLILSLSVIRGNSSLWYDCLEYLSMYPWYYPDLINLGLGCNIIKTWEERKSKIVKEIETNEMHLLSAMQYLLGEEERVEAIEKLVVSRRYIAAEIYFKKEKVGWDSGYPVVYGDLRGSTRLNWHANQVLVLPGTTLKKYYQMLTA